MLIGYLPRLVGTKLSLRTVLGLLCCAVLVVPIGPLISSEAALQADQPRMGHPRPGAPESELPNLEEVKRRPAHVRTRPAIPSTIRSQKNAERPWDGRRVGNPLPTIGSTAGPAAQTRRLRGSKGNHTRVTRVRAAVSPPVTDEAFMQNFFYWALSRYASGYEPPYWNDQLRVAYGQSQESLKLAAIELGKTLFESAEYAARNRDNHWYVYDLYKTYLMRDPDPGGWAFWESSIPGSGRENVRRGFEDSGEFHNLIATITPNGSPSSSPSSLITARVDPTNQPNNGMIVRDAAWSLPLLKLPGRADLDLGLSLSYSSMVWTRSGPYIYFDEDTGFPSPGFRLGFPNMQRRVFDSQTARNAYLLLTPAGRRVELRQVGTSNIYEAADSSYLQLTDNGSTKLLRTTDGTQLTFSEFNNELRCTQVKDRNGNYITVSYDGWGHITTIVDTLGRNITFNYDGNANLLSITQNWNGTNHQWVSFGWTTRTMQSSFTGVSTVGPPNGTVLPVISQVNIDDGSYYQFDYTNSLQVLSITRKSFDNVQRSQTTFTYETPASDVPRLSDSRLTASNWTGINGVPAQIIMQYSVAGDGACVLTTPDGTVYKDYYGTGWQKGLSTLREVWVGGVRQKWTTTSWTQDNTAVSYQINPRATEMNVYDSSGNRRRTTIDYYPTSSFSLPSDVYEYAADATTVLRRHHRDYNLNPAYTDRRLIGLLFAEYLYDGAGGLHSKVMYHRDWGAPWLVDQGATIQHDDANYGSGFIVGRGNVHLIERYDVEYPNDPARIISTKTGYNTAGSVTFTADGLWHRTDYAYTDAFSDSINRNTLAYPTTITDHDGFSSTVQYNFDFGVITRTQSPPPAGQTQGLIQTMLYNAAGQLERVTTVNSGAYRRFWYGPDYVASYASVNNVADEAYSIQTFDGLGRVIGEASNHPGSSGGYKALNTIYDQMGRVFKASNPVEITGSWVPTGDDAGWLYTQQTYDWQGRPLVTTNTDGTTKEVSYSGCGCAGGEVATLTDEGTIDGGIAKRRQKKIYADVLGRQVKTELLNWQGGPVYSASVNTYNARDQVTQIRQYAGVEGSGSFQDTTITYDGYGRVKTKHLPEQGAGASTVLNYNADDTISTVTDARGAVTTYGYNGRHLLTSLSYSAPTGITVPAPVSFAYDAADNRTFMADGSGNTTYQYDQLSRITSEAHNINGLVGTQSIGYTYALTGQLSSLTDPQGRTVSYAYDSVGMLSSVTGSGYTNASQFANNFQYRAWGAAKHFNIGFDWWNGTSSLTPANLWYDSRMQLTHFKLDHPNTAAGPIYDSTYQYYADGKPKFISDVRAWSIQEGWPPTENMHHFDRGYRYDHLGRLTAGLTGDEARGGTNPDGPYNESYQYDAWHNMNQRTNRIWSKPVDNISYTYVNNRKQGVPWQYDADGNETSEATFDAAGRKAGFFTYLFLGLGSEGQFDWYSANAQATYDGNGQLVKEQDSIGSTTYMTVFYVRSAVLGGEPVMMVKDEPYNGTGTVTRTASIYGNGARIGFSTDGYVRFEHSEPLTGRRTSVSEVDPLGQEVGAYDPGPEEPGDVGHYPEPHEFGNAEDPGMGCTLDGISIDCGTATRLLNTGTVGLASSGNKVVTDSNGQRILVRNEPTFGEVILGSFWEWVDDSGKKPTGQPEDDPDSDVIRIDGWIPRGHWGEVVQLGVQARGQARGQRGGRTRRGRRQRRTQTPAAPPPSACARFAEELANRLYNTVVLAGGFNPDSRHDLANEMNRRGRNNVDFNGRAYGKQTYPIDGFRPALTANGQLADVYRHILFTAGNSLHGTVAADAENTAFRLYDWQQSARGRAESDTELADDDAGMAVGELMLNTALAGRSGNYAQLMADIRNILCAF